MPQYGLTKIQVHIRVWQGHESH